VRLCKPLDSIIVYWHNWRIHGYKRTVPSFQNVPSFACNSKEQKAKDMKLGRMRLLCPSDGPTGYSFPALCRPLRISIPLAGTFSAPLLSHFLYFLCGSSRFFQTKILPSSDSHLSKAYNLAYLPAKRSSSSDGCCLFYSAAVAHLLHESDG